jgi:hypothetical protein
MPGARSDGLLSLMESSVSRIGAPADDVLVPTVILLGSFLVPVSMVVLAVSRRRQQLQGSERAAALAAE